VTECVLSVVVGFRAESKMAVVLPRIDVDLSDLNEDEQAQIRAVIERDEQLREQLQQRIQSVTTVDLVRYVYLLTALSLSLRWLGWADSITGQSGQFVYLCVCLCVNHSGTITATRRDL